MGGGYYLLSVKWVISLGGEHIEYSDVLADYTSYKTVAYVLRKCLIEGLAEGLVQCIGSKELTIKLS